MELMDFTFNQERGHLCNNFEVTMDLCIAVIYMVDAGVVAYDSTEWDRLNTPDKAVSKSIYLKSIFTM